MKPSIYKLHKFFKLEADRGYDNRAVMGGLDRILDSWEVEARNDNLPEEFIQSIRTQLRTYQNLNETDRMDCLRQIWQNLRDADPGLPQLVFQPPVKDQDQIPTSKPAPAPSEGGIEPAFEQ